MNEIKQNSPYAWFLAARPKTLTGAIIPVLLGSALAFSDGQFKTAPALLCALFACGMQIAANFINDLFDFQKGTDRREDRLGPQRAECGTHQNCTGASPGGGDVMLYCGWTDSPNNYGGIDYEAEERKQIGFRSVQKQDRAYAVYRGRQFRRKRAKRGEYRT